MSKAIFNLSYSKSYDSIGDNKIAVLLHIYNEDSIKEIINKINNIPYIYDLFIYIYININIYNLRHYINLNSKAHYFEFKSFLNKKESLLSSIYIFRNKAKNYKYLCNIKSSRNIEISYYEEWKNYIQNNLLGNSRIISEIITDFEINRKLGIIFPEKYYKSLVHSGDSTSDINLKYMNYILSKIFSHTHIEQKLFDYPEGNMFWAKVEAIYPIFNLLHKVIITNKFSLMIDHILEYIWVFIIKLDGFLYKKIFKHL